MIQYVEPMKIRQIITHLLILSFSATAFAKAAFRLDSLDDQFQKSIQFMYQNMTQPDASPGAIVAAPSHDHPDYYYHWVRDAALTVQAALDLYENGQVSSRQKQDLRK